MTERFAKIKKEFWDKYTLLFNQNPEAFELMRELGERQGNAIGKAETLKQVQDMIDKKMETIRKYIRNDNHPTLKGDELNLILHHLREIKQKLEKL